MKLSICLSIVTLAFAALWNASEAKPVHIISADLRKSLQYKGKSTKISNPLSLCYVTKFVELFLFIQIFS